MKSLFAIVLALLLVEPLVALEDPGPRYDHTMIFDIPHAQLLAQYGRLPGRDIILTEGLEDDCPFWRCHLGDTLRMLAILLEWDDRPHTYPVEAIDSMLFARDCWPGGSVADYFYEVSYGNLTIVGNAEGWFNAGSFDRNPPMEWYDSVVASLDPFIDYSQYDGNNDGYVDAICFVYAGSCYIYSGDLNDPGAYAWYYGDVWSIGPFDGVMAGKFHTSPETMPIRNPDNPNEFTGEIAVSCIVPESHELSHNLGLPDLYDMDASDASFTTPGDVDDHPMVDWCIMDGSQEGYAFEISDPAHHCGWSKMKLRWLEAITLEGEYQNLVIYSFESHPDSALYKLPINDDGGEYFLLEYRNPYSTHKFGKYTTDFSRYFYPALNYGSELFDRGLLITHVDDSVMGIPDYPFYALDNDGRPNFPHYGVTVVDAGHDPNRDCTYNPEGQLTDSAQWWYPYETRLAAAFSSDVPGQSEFGPNTVPSSDGYSGSSGITVCVDSIVGDRLYMYVNKPPWVPPSYVCGDANGDGVVTQADVAYLIDYLHKDGPAPVPIEAGDANGDGKVDRKDANYLVDYLHKDGPAPICP